MESISGDRFCVLGAFRESFYYDIKLLLERGSTDNKLFIQGNRLRSREDGETVQEGDVHISFGCTMLHPHRLFIKRTNHKWRLLSEVI